MANEIGMTEVTNVSQALIASVVQEVLKQKSILLPTITDYSAMVGPGAKSVSIPKRTQFAAGDKAENTALTAQELTFSADALALSKHKAIYAKLEKIAGLQANVAVAQEIVTEMASELALQVDKDLITVLKAVSAAGPDHLLDYNSPADTLAEGDILHARYLLNKQNVPMSDRYLVISPDQEKAVLQIANFIQQDRYAGNQAIMTGELGMAYGFRILIHNELSAADALFYHKSHVAFARQLQPEFMTDVNLALVSQEFLMHHIYGTATLDSGKRGVYYNGAGA